MSNSTDEARKLQVELQSLIDVLGTAIPDLEAGRFDGAEARRINATLLLQVARHLRLTSIAICTEPKVREWLEVECRKLTFFRDENSAVQVAAPKFFQSLKAQLRAGVSSLTLAYAEMTLEKAWQKVEAGERRWMGLLGYERLAGVTPLLFAKVQVESVPWIRGSETLPALTDDLAVALSEAMEHFDYQRFDGMTLLHDAYAAKTIIELCEWLKIAPDLISELRSIKICCRELLDAFCGGSSVVSASAVNASVYSDESELIFRLDGDGYFLKGFGEEGHVTAKGAKGLYDLFRLVQSPGVPVTMLELDAGPGTKRAEGDEQSRQSVVDDLGKRQIAAEMNQVIADIANIDSTDPSSNMERSELEEKLTQLKEAAKGMTGLNGKPRDLNNPLDKLRPKLLKRISNASAKLRQANFAKLADHFEQTVFSESGCMVYRPAVEGLTWSVTNL